MLDSIVVTYLSDGFDPGIYGSIKVGMSSVCSVEFLRLFAPLISVKKLGTWDPSSFLADCMDIGDLDFAHLLPSRSASSILARKFIAPKCLSFRFMKLSFYISWAMLSSRGTNRSITPL